MNNGLQKHLFARATAAQGVAHREVLRADTSLDPRFYAGRASAFQEMAGTVGTDLRLTGFYSPSTHVFVPAPGVLPATVLDFVPLYAYKSSTVTSQPERP